MTIVVDRETCAFYTLLQPIGSLRAYVDKANSWTGVLGLVMY